jgi:hypothetical protein
MQPTGTKATSWLAFLLLLFLNMDSRALLWASHIPAASTNYAITPAPHSASYKVAMLRCPPLSPPQTPSSQYVTAGKTPSEVRRFLPEAPSVAAKFWDSNDHSLNWGTGEEWRWQSYCGLLGPSQWSPASLRETRLEVKSMNYHPVYHGDGNRCQEKQHGV